MNKVALLFPGQGAQTIGMGRELYEKLPQAKALFVEAAEILGYDLAQICFNGPADRLNSTVISQPAMYVCSLAALEMLKATQPDILDRAQGAAGLSLGEYTAITFAGGLSFFDGLKLVQQRGEAMQAAADEIPSGMVSVLGLDREQVQQVCTAARVEREILEPANFLCPGNSVVSGHRASCEQVAAVAADAGAMKSIPLPVAGAFHTELMRGAVQPLSKALNQIDFQPTRVPVYSNVDGRPHDQPGDFKILLREQVCSPVFWQDSMESMLAEGFDQFYEVGPGRVLCGLMKRIARQIPCQGVSN